NYFDDQDVLSAVIFDPSAVYNFKTEVDWQEVASKLPRAGTDLTYPTTSLVPMANTNMSNRRAALYGDTNSTAVHSISPTTNATGFDAELAVYIDHCLSGSNTSYDALDFWRIHGSNFPRLSILAKSYLSTPPSSVSAERVFSVAGLLFRNHLKNRLSADHAEQMIL
ncbi:hypothetical protein PFISCL1PPCAC_13243, partial [Pristionchus fissidentatus]